MIGSTILSLLLLCPPSPTRSFPNMNEGAYLLSQTPKQKHNNWSTNFADYPGGVEYIEFYTGPIQSTYSEVFWTPLPQVNLSQKLIQRFNNKAMSVIGLEADQVRRTKDGDVSLPISLAYNHHYGFNLVGKGSAMQYVPTPPVGPDKMTTHPGPRPGHSYLPVEHTPSNHTPFPSSIVLGYSNGGEYRKTYHALAPPFAQIIESPTHFSVVPMQIDTWNRDLMNLSGSRFQPGPAPKNSFAPTTGPDAIYSGLLECPLTTRIRKRFTGGGWNNSVIASLTPCSKGGGTAPSTPASCFAEAAEIYQVGTLVHQTLFNDSTVPKGCTLLHDANQTVVQFNSAPHETLTCGDQIDTTQGTQTTNHGLTSVSIQMSVEKGTVQITLTGPNNVWYGVGFNTISMSNSPYAMIVGGVKGAVTEHRLGQHQAGTVLSNSVHILSNTVVHSVRTVVVERSFKGMTPQHHTFDPLELHMDIISAYGASAHFSYHKAKETSAVALWPVATGRAAQVSPATMCVCSIPAAKFGQGQGDLEYLTTGETIGFPFRCNPTESVLHAKNPTCDIRTYAGGLSTCHHKWHLLDADQTVPWLDQPLEYWLKFRVYFQPYQPALHIETFDITWTIAGATGEYDVPQCAPGTPVEECTHEVTGVIVPPGKDLHFVAAHYHCHAPTCLSIEIWTWDSIRNQTIELLCKESPYHGRGSVGTDKFDEEGYIAVPICLWGLHPPFDKPPLVSGVPLFVKATTNNTYAHHGEMALPQMLLAHLGM